MKTQNNAAFCSGVDPGDADNKRNRQMQSPKLRAAQEAAAQSLAEQAARQQAAADAKL